MMLTSAWEWLVGILAAGTAEGPADREQIVRTESKTMPGPAWLESEWDSEEERTTMDCVMATPSSSTSSEEEEGFFRGLQEVSEDECGTCITGTEEMVAKYLESSAANQRRPCGTRTGKKGRSTGPWREQAKTRQPESASPTSTWQSFASTAFRLMSEDAGPPPLEYDRTPPPAVTATPPRSESVKQSLDSIVCQTRKEDESTSVPWQQLPERDTPPAVGLSRTLFDGLGASEEFLLPPQRSEFKGKRTLVLDLDETLVHSVFQPAANADFTLKVQLEQGPLDVYVIKRPGVDKFLEEMAAKYEVVVFTASVREYADPLMDVLDPKGLVAHRLFRESCSNSGNGYVKDLARMGRSLSEMIIVDNSPHSYAYQPDNALPILSFYDDMSDTELSKISPFLVSLGDVAGDVRNLLGAALGAGVKSLLHSRLAML